MGQSAVAIPEKLFFKIGEVCDIVGVQAHVLRYWESEFPMLAPQKNRAGQRTYRKRDVEMALQIKALLYEELYTIPGARKRLTQEIRGASKIKLVTPEINTPANITTEAELAAPIAPPVASPAPTYSAKYIERETDTTPDSTLSDKQRQNVRRLYSELQELLIILDNSDAAFVRRTQ
ncbi:MAG: hypothetical protein NVSMB56_05490 [Pyrinomonadaceae bacterium]